MKLVHFADLHLDAHFAWLGDSNGLAAARRQALRDTLENIIGVVRETNADALLCGGDLFEHERVTPDTAEFLKAAFRSLGPVRVFLAPGNHDWYGPQSVYKLTSWSDNVHVFRTDGLEPVELGDGIRLWGAAHCGPARTSGFLESFSADSDRVNLGLFHGSERHWAQEQEGNKHLHAPFDEADIARSGLQFAFLGHYHRPKNTQWLCYPGNPCPLEFGEDRERGAVVADVSREGVVRLEQRRVSPIQVSELPIDVTGSTNSQDVVRLVRTALDGVEGYVRATVHGELTAEAEFDQASLEASVNNPRIQLRVGAIRYGYDLDAIRMEETVRGQFVRDVEADSTLDADLRRRIVITGLRALDGRADLEVA